MAAFTPHPIGVVGAMVGITMAGTIMAGGIIMDTTMGTMVMPVITACMVTVAAIICIQAEAIMVEDTMAVEDTTSKRMK